MYFQMVKLFLKTCLNMKKKRKLINKQHFEFYTVFHCVLGLMEMSAKLMDNFLCNRLQVAFCYFTDDFFYNASKGPTI